MIALLLLLAAAEPAPPSAACREGLRDIPKDHRSFPGIRQLPDLICAYDRSELHTRLLRMLKVKRSALSVEAVRQTFGLPFQPPQYDDRTRTRFQMLVRRPGSSGPWRVLLVYDERTIAAEGSTFARKKVPADKRFEFQTTAPDAPVNGTPSCLPLRQFIIEAKAAGWHKPLDVPVLSPHPSTIHSVSLTRGDGLALVFTVNTKGYNLTEDDIDAGCLTSFQIRTN